MKIVDIVLWVEWIIQDLFSRVLVSDDKEVWKKALDFIIKKTEDLEKNCWEWKFVWRKVRSIMSDKYGKKFIK